MNGNLSTGVRSRTILLPMNRRGLPSWLYWDLIAFVGVWMSFWAFAPRMLEISQKLEADPSARLTKVEIGLLGRVLAAAEAWLDYAVLRRAFRLAGLKASRVAWRRPSPPLNNLAFGHRAKLYLTRFYGLEAYARTRAVRLKRTLAQADDDDDFQTSIPNPENLGTLLSDPNPATTNFSRRPVDGDDDFPAAAIRGPPRPAARASKFRARPSPQVPLRERDLMSLTHLHTTAATSQRFRAFLCRSSRNVHALCRRRMGPVEGQHLLGQIPRRRRLRLFRRA